MNPPVAPRQPSRYTRAVLHWADGRIWDVVVPDGEAWHFNVDGHSYCFELTDAVDCHGIAIWAECPPDEPTKPPTP